LFERREDFDMASLPAPALPWWRVIPPFAWITQPRVRRLRPAGHSAWVEAMHQPVLLLISLAFTTAGLYTLAKDFFLKTLAAIGAGDQAQIVPLVLALFVIVITGLAIEITFLTAASRLRMHVLRQEWGWATPAAIMLVLTTGVEGLTCSYMLYLIDHPLLPAGMATFMANIPTLLFFVRAFAALICAAYLIIFVLPFVIRPQDIRRELASEAGAAKVAIIQRLLHRIPDLSTEQLLNIYEPVAAIFRDNAGHGDLAEEDANTLQALRLLRERLLEERTSLPATVFPESPRAIAPMREDDTPDPRPDEVEDEALVPMPAIMRQRTSSRRRNPMKPPLTYTLLSDTARRLQQAGQPPRIYTLSQATGYSENQILSFIQQLKDERIRNLHPGQQLPPDPVLDLV
jgi:hypothetical protein